MARDATPLGNIPGMLDTPPARHFSARHWRWVLALPKFGIVLLLSALLALLWLLHLNEIEEERTALIKDVHPVLNNEIHGNPLLNNPLF